MAYAEPAKPRLSCGFSPQLAPGSRAPYVGYTSLSGVAPRPRQTDNTRMDIKHGLGDSLGSTPMIRLKRASEETGCDILGKAEFLNPGQSVKDRAALYIIKDAVARGALKPGGVIVEGTAGNTGIGLALVGNALGFRSVIVIPETQ